MEAATPSDDRFVLNVPSQRVVFGAGVVDALPQELEALGVGRVLLVATRSAKDAADRLTEQLGPRVAARVHEVVQHVPASTVASALDLAEAGVDVVLTIGGGSATGLGKAVAVQTGLPLVAVPTTYAGSEATPVYGITGEHKHTASDPRALPRVVVYDPVLTTTMPAHVTATSGLNALAHCVEAMYAPGANPLTSLIAQEGISRLTRALPAAVHDPGDLTARSDALYGAYLAGWSMATAGTALHHKLCHAIGGTYRVDHGEVHAVLLPYVAAYNAPASPAALERVARALGASDADASRAGRAATPSQTAREAAPRLRRLAERLRAPRGLASIGLPAEALDDVLERTLDAVGDSNPRRPDAATLGQLLDDAYAGRPPGAYE